MNTRVQESRDRESTEGSENGIRIVAPASFGVFNCGGLLEFNLHTSVSYCAVIHSCVVILHCVGISSCVSSAPSRCILKNRKTHAWLLRVEFLLKTDSRYPKDTGVNKPWQPLGIPFAITLIGQLHESPPSPIPGDLGRCDSHQSPVLEHRDTYGQAQICSKGH